MTKSAFPFTARIACVAMVSFICMPFAIAHHSFTAEFDASRKATLTGTVTQVWYKNPHVRYLFTVANEEGEEETWDARGSPVVWLARKGWGRNAIKVGDTIAVYGYLGHGESKLISIMTITLEDGTVLVDKAPE